MGPVYFNPPLGLDEIHLKTVNHVKVSGSREETDSSRTVTHIWCFVVASTESSQLHRRYKPTTTGTSSSIEETLLFAVMEGDSNKAREILRERYVDVTVLDSAGWTAVHYAVRRGYRSIINDVLWQERANVAVQDELGQQYIHSIAERGDCDLLTRGRYECR
jgi:hypothetical protein